MKSRIYVILDTVAQISEAPFLMVNDGVCRRAIRDMILEGKEKYCRHPEDYALLHVGDFDTSTGGIESCAPEFCGTLKDIVSTTSGETSPIIGG